MHTPENRTRKSRVPRRRSTISRTYLANCDPAVREHLAGAVDLPTFFGSVDALTPDERKLIVRQALILIEQNYAHLPLKRAMHAVEPVQRLRILLQRLEDDTAPLADTDFHREMTGTFTSLHDLHTNYLLPEPYASMVAFLPFAIEDYTEDGTRHFIVAHITPGFEHPDFVTGVEVTHWNGMQIGRAVAVQARHYAGSNPDAQHARAVETMTMRMLLVAAPPDEDWVIVGYRTLEGKPKELRFDWMVNPPMPADQGGDASATDEAMGLDVEQHLVYETRKVLFAPQVHAEAAASDANPLASTLPTVFEAKSVQTPSGEFGCIRIRTFSVQNTEGFVSEFLRLITALPQNGLIIDVRGNGGGVIFNGERILQLLTPRRIEPEPTQFITTALNRQICQHNAKFEKWGRSMAIALQTGAAFSAGFSITDAEDCNRLGQRYFGPVLLITDALCYSTTDIFAAGFQDHDIGPILGVDSTTGAGGANVWTHKMLQAFMPSQYEPLPKHAGMRVSMRRTLRVGPRAGTPVEDLGVRTPLTHPLTRNDILNKNVDLINRAGELLAALPVRAMKLEMNGNAVKVVTSRMDRLDVYLEERPSFTFDVENGETTFELHGAQAAQTLEIRGFEKGELVARYREVL